MDLAQMPGRIFALKTYYLQSWRHRTHSPNPNSTSTACTHACSRSRREGGSIRPIWNGFCKGEKCYACQFECDCSPGPQDCGWCVFGVIFRPDTWPRMRTGLRIVGGVFLGWYFDPTLDPGWGRHVRYTLTFSPPLLPRSDVPHTPAAEEFLRKFTTKTPFIRKIRTE
jgi:hypothetical protein